MWSRLKQLFSDYSSKKRKSVSDEPDDRVLIDSSIQEIERMIRQSEKVVEETRKNKAHIEARSKELEAKSLKLQQQASRELSLGNEARAELYLAHREDVEKQLQPYRGLLQSVSSSIQHLENQIEKLRFKATEIKTRKSLLEAQLQQANSEREVQQIVGQFSACEQLFEDEILQTQIETDLREEFLALDAKTEQTTEVQLQDQLNSLKEEKRSQNAKKIDSLFQQLDANLPKIPKKEPDTQTFERKQVLLARLLSLEEKGQMGQELHEKKASYLEAFFKGEEKSSIGQDKQKLMDDFFEHKPLNNNDSNQKKIDDFFSNT